KPGRRERLPAHNPLRTVREVSLHTAQAFLKDSPITDARSLQYQLGDLCPTDRQPKRAAILTPVLRRTNRQASIDICISQTTSGARVVDDLRRIVVDVAVSGRVDSSQAGDEDCGE